MIQIDPTLPEAERELLVALRDFLAARGIGPEDVAIGPADGVTEKSAAFALAYRASNNHIEQANTLVCWPMAEGRTCVETRLAPGIRLFAMLLGEGWARKAGQIPITAGPRDALSSLGIVPARHVRNFLDETAGLRFIAPHAGGFVHAFADIRPPLDLISWSDKPAAVAVHLAVGEAEQATDIASTLAEYLPDFDE